MSETAETPVVETKAKTTKAKPEVTEVTMNDGRVVKFVGKRNLNKDYTIDEGAGTVTAIFDFRTGDTVKFTTGIDDLEMLLTCAGHGAIQKGGDETSKVKALENGEPDLESQVLAVEAVVARLSNTAASLDDRWYKETEAGDGFSGASVVIKAIMEFSAENGKPLTAPEVKAMIEKRLEKGKTDEPPLTRQRLFQAYRKPGTKIAAIISRMEQEKLAATAPKIDVDAELLGAV
jgi:hypothetical protein